MDIRPFEHQDTDALVKLWERCGLTRPQNNPRLDIERKLKVQSQWFFVGLINKVIIASVMAGYEGHRGWINYLAIDPAYQRSGLGHQLVQKVEQCLLEAGCPKINLQIRLENTDAIAFYKSLGYEKDEVVSYGKRLILDDDKPAT
jgi:ribosomal protein S18 acetylase RimI-like enzyme